MLVVNLGEQRKLYSDVGYGKGFVHLLAQVQGSRSKGTELHIGNSYTRKTYRPPDPLDRARPQGPARGLRRERRHLERNAEPQKLLLLDGSHILGHESADELIGPGPCENAANVDGSESGMRHPEETNRVGEGTVLGTGEGGRLREEESALKRFGAG